MSRPNTRIPALVVSGFLGSGKTTLVRHLLACAQRDGVRVAVVSNELGALGIDRALLGSGGEAFIELEGGCVCCELSDELVETLQQLYEQVRPDRIVIETSGAALPYDTQLNFWREPVSDWIGDDMAVVVVNAEQLLEGRDLEGTFEDQVHSADLMLLNKVDLVGAEVEAVEACLRAIEPEAPIVRCEQGRLDPAIVFPPDALASERSRSAPSPLPHHHETFETEIQELDSNCTRAQIERIVGRPGLLRAKGFVRIDDELHLVQVVGRRVEIEPAEVAPPPGAVNKLLLISRR